MGTGKLSKVLVLPCLLTFLVASLVLVMYLNKTSGSENFKSDSNTLINVLSMAIEELQANLMNYIVPLITDGDKRSMFIRECQIIDEYKAIYDDMTASLNTGVLSDLYHQINRIDNLISEILASNAERVEESGVHELNKKGISQLHIVRSNIKSICSTIDSLNSQSIN